MMLAESMNLGEWVAIIISIIAVFLTALSVVGGGVWIVSKVTTTVDGLKEAMNRLSAAVDRLDECFDDHHLRLDRLERQTNECGDGPHISWPGKDPPSARDAQNQD